MEQSEALRIHELINLNRWLRVDLVDILNQLFGVVFLNELNALICYLLNFLLVLLVLLPLKK
jgi:hypothetical protein